MKMMIKMINKSNIRRKTFIEEIKGAGMAQILKAASQAVGFLSQVQISKKEIKTSISMINQVRET